MTYELTVIYHQPEDPGAFDAYYETTHAPLARRLPGLESYTATRPEPGRDGTPAGAYVVAALRFADKVAFGTAMSSEEGKATAEDLPRFATGGVTMLTGEVTTYV
jgi:uncharacterized protein (TIGR02118 family)